MWLTDPNKKPPRWRAWGLLSYRAYQGRVSRKEN